MNKVYHHYYHYKVFLKYVLELNTGEKTKGRGISITTSFLRRTWIQMSVEVF